MIFEEVVKICEKTLLNEAKRLYGLLNVSFQLVGSHEGGRNVVYRCVENEENSWILRISYLNDRNLEELLGEAEFIRYLYEHKGNVANVISSINNNLVEVIKEQGNTFYLCLFEKAKGKQLAENNYQYREGVSIKEYYYNSGKVLGKLHQLSKEYTPEHRRYSYYDKYSIEYIKELIPDTFLLLKEKLYQLIHQLEELPRDSEVFGLVHFDYNDGNYMIDYNTGDLTVYDFDNSCYCWYLYDLADLWCNGMGWTQFEADKNKRKQFMEEYFKTVLEGYQSETKISTQMMDQFPLLIQMTVMETIVDAFEEMRNNGEEIECDENLSYYIKCIEEEIPYYGFFDEIYSCEAPFEYESRED